MRLAPASRACYTTLFTISVSRTCSPAGSLLRCNTGRCRRISPFAFPLSFFFPPRNLSNNSQRPIRTHHRSRVLESAHQNRQQERQASTVGYRGPRTLPLRHQELLSRRSRCAARLRYHKVRPSLTTPLQTRLNIETDLPHSFLADDRPSSRFRAGSRMRARSRLPTSSLCSWATRPTAATTSARSATSKRASGPTRTACSSSRPPP